MRASLTWGGGKNYIARAFSSQVFCANYKRRSRSHLRIRHHASQYPSAIPPAILAQGSWCGEEAGVSLLQWRKFVCGVMIVIWPASLLAQTSNRALLHSDGGTWLNGSPAPAISAIFPDSLVQTQAGHSARIDAERSTVRIGPETVMQYQGSELALDHGSLQLDTAREMKVLIGCITVSPITSDRTQYDVTDVDGKVKVVASKNDVKIHLHGSIQKSRQGASSDIIVREGEQATRSEHCGAAPKPTAGLNADGAILNSPWAKGVGIAAVGVLTCWALCRGDDPVSPSKP